MRRVRDISDKDNFRVVEMGGFGLARRDPVEPEPVGTIVLIPFRVTGYDQDCDGSLMARLEAIEANGEPTGWDVNAIGLHPTTGIVVSGDELKDLFDDSTN